MSNERKRGHRWPAVFVVLFSLALFAAACGSDGGSTVTVTSLDEQAQADATAASALESEAIATSDAAAAIPGNAATEGAIDPVTGLLPGQEAADVAAADATAAAVPATSPNLTAGEPILNRPFSSASPWNMPIVGMPVDRRSDKWLRGAQLRQATVERRNGDIRQVTRRITVGVTINTEKWTVPVFSNSQPGATERITICRQIDCGPDAVSSVTIPPDACPDPRYDGWMTVLDNVANTALDFWRARCEADGSISYQFSTLWNPAGTGFQEPGESSVRGSGLPLFAGLITPEEIRRGKIDHALALSVPGVATRRYVQPASRTDGTGRKDSLPEGARVRLKSGGFKLTRTFVRNGRQRKAAEVIIAALQQYGAILVDRAAAPTLYAQRNADWAGVLPLNLLQDIHLKNFEAMAAPPILFDPPRQGEETANVGGGPKSTIELGSPTLEEVAP